MPSLYNTLLKKLLLSSRNYNLVFIHCYYIHTPASIPRDTS